MTISNRTPWEPLKLDSIYDTLLLILDAGCISLPMHFPLGTNGCQFGVIMMLISYKDLYFYTIPYICTALKNAESFPHVDLVPMLLLFGKASYFSYLLVEGSDALLGQHLYPQSLIQ